jgi:hypothetical protein
MPNRDDIGSTELKKYIEKNDLIDVWRARNPKVVSQILSFVSVMFNFFDTPIVKLFISILVCSHHSKLFF